MAPVKMSRTFVPRLLELSNDVEKNPGPPKVIKNGLIPPGSAGSNNNNNNSNRDRTNGKMADKADAAKPAKENGTTAKTAAVVEDGLSASAAVDFEGLRQIVERQAEVIRTQKVEMECAEEADGEELAADAGLPVGDERDQVTGCCGSSCCWGGKF